LDADFGVPLAFAGLIALAIAPEIRNMTGGDAGDATGDGTGDAGDIPNAETRETGSSQTEPVSPGRVLWSRRDEGLDGTDSTDARVSADVDRDAFPNPQGSGVLWTRAEDDDAAARRRESRKKKGARSRRSGGRNGLEDAPTRETSSLAKKENPRTVRNDGVGGLSLGPPTESLMNQGLGPVEDENMENVRFSPRK
jgi:hypothetical protein